MLFRLNVVSETYLLAVVHIYVLMTVDYSGWRFVVQLMDLVAIDRDMSIVFSIIHTN